MRSKPLADATPDARLHGPTATETTTKDEVQVGLADARRTGPVGFYGPVGRAAASVRVPSIRGVASNGQQLNDIWTAILQEQETIHQTGKNNKGQEAEYWVRNANLSEIDFAMNLLIDGVQAAPVAAAAEDTVDTNPVEMVRDFKIHLGTCVLATVYCPAWLLFWMQSLATLVITSGRTCDSLVMHAVQCGPMCNCEILLIAALLKELGFTLAHRQAWDDIDGVYWLWQKKRPGGNNDFEVILYLYYSAKKVTTEALCKSMLPYTGFSKIPNLKRCVVVSAPVTIFGTEERVDEVLNVKLVEALDKLLPLASEFGFYQENEGAWEKELEKCEMWCTTTQTLPQVSNL